MARAQRCLILGWFLHGFHLTWKMSFLLSSSESSPFDMALRGNPSRASPASSERAPRLQSHRTRLQLRGGLLSLSSDDDSEYQNEDTESRLLRKEAEQFEAEMRRNMTIAPISYDRPFEVDRPDFTEMVRHGSRILDEKQRLGKLAVGSTAEQIAAADFDIDAEPEAYPMTAEGVFEKAVQLHNMIEEKFAHNKAEEERLSTEQSLYVEPAEDEEGEPDPPESDEIVTDEYTGMQFNMSKPLEELTAQLGIYEIPVATAEDFLQAEDEHMPTATRALDAWDLFKGKDADGFDMICMRHRRWGTELELFIGSTGRVKLRPDERHQVLMLYADGTWMEVDAGTWDFDGEHIFKHLRANPGCGWLEAMGGADAWLVREQEPTVPEGAEKVDLDRVRSRDGWTPMQDRVSDVDLFNTTYLRPSEAPGWEDEPWVCQAMDPVRGFWTVREYGGKLAWTNSMGLSEVWLTAEGLYYLGADEMEMVEPRQAVRIEYGLGGCVDGETQMMTLDLQEARWRLGLPDGGDIDVTGEEAGSVRRRLREWTEAYGWHDLPHRLMERGKDDWEAFRALKRQWKHEFDILVATETILPEPIKDNIYQIGNRTVQLRQWDAEDMPSTIEDVDTGEVIWRKGQPVQYTHPWAREGLRVEQAGGRTRVVETKTGAVLADFEEEPW